MRQIKVADLMTDEVVCAAPGTAFGHIVQLLEEHGISGLPVLDDEDRVLGVVSRTDLLAHLPPEARTPGKAGGAPKEAGGAPGEAAGPATAAEVMSVPAVTVRADEPAAGAARLMARCGVDRLPVVDVEDRLVGIVTRRDLLHLFLRPDAEIRRRVVTEVLDAALGLPSGAVDVHVVHGVVALEGHVERQSQLTVLRGLVERLDGVVSVVSHVTALVDDTGSRSAMAW
ncbi:HPP family protein [Streptomyces sp. NPDC090445]|uniref:CBS domain-containing protein n=1 Tax=Streptomyces sp. NPDC090445 TaxID=3365963 RepID=UPI0037FDA3EA